MATVHKISGDFYEDSFALIALHSSMEDHALAYAINLTLNSNFKRTKEDLDVSQSISFPIFEWKDIVNDRDYTLIANSSIKEEKKEQDGLFQFETSFTKYHLIPEYKEVDYLLKIEQDENVVEENIIESILSIPRIVTAYVLDTEQLKSKKNLIF
ncbi:hypothetical protein GGR42_001766 [Saonia flava]|uniref:IPExxxVDY family protein n=1 Tax=Saonia flava TaxID=523696 RepID=A0A846R1P5_9FLAO|nr:IPExxxVDY family protein [Saonia flava]NJB71304.1 hypothetical protein [Saonia flava]